MCTSNCATQDHETWGDCIRAKALRIGYCQSAAGRDATAQRRWDAELDRYKAARADGIQPEGTSTAKINQAVALSEKHGVAYGTPAFEAAKTAALNEVINQ